MRPGRRRFVRAASIPVLTTTRPRRSSCNRTQDPSFNHWGADTAASSPAVLRTRAAQRSVRVAALHVSNAWPSALTAAMSLALRSARLRVASVRVGRECLSAASQLELLRQRTPAASSWPLVRWSARECVPRSARELAQRGVRCPWSLRAFPSDALTRVAASRRRFRSAGRDGMPQSSSPGGRTEPCIARTLTTFAVRSAHA